MLGVILRRRDDCSRALLPPLTRDARKRGELARCPAPSSRARGLWDSLEAPTKRHEMFPAYRSGRAFDEELIEQLNVMPEFVAAFGFANAKAQADDFLVAAEERAGGTAIVASGDRDSFQLASSSTMILYPSRGGDLESALGRRRSGDDMESIQNKCRTSLRSAVTLLTNCLARPASDRNAPLNCCDGTAALMGCSKPASFKLRLRCSASIG
jgi:hypothetical protein